MNLYTLCNGLSYFSYINMAIMALPTFLLRKTPSHIILKLAKTGLLQNGNYVTAFKKTLHIDLCENRVWCIFKLCHRPHAHAQGVKHSVLSVVCHAVCLSLSQFLVMPPVVSTRKSLLCRLLIVHDQACSCNSHNGSMWPTKFIVLCVCVCVCILMQQYQKYI